MKLRALQVTLAGLAIISLAAAFSTKGTGQEPSSKARKVVKTDAEWRKLLTREQYLVTRQADTEPAFSGKLWNNHAKGTYECICCGTELFSSKTKFESGTGWPSFYAPYNQKNVDTSTDFKLGYARTEVTCNTCGAHLGHVFDDGPPPTGLRFCMNSASMKFVKDSPAKPAAKPKDEKAEKKEVEEKAKKTETDEQKTNKDEKAEKKDTPAKETAPADSPK